MTPNDQQPRESQTQDTGKKEPILMNWLIIIATIAGVGFAALAFMDI